MTKEEEPEIANRSQNNIEVKYTIVVGDYTLDYLIGDVTDEECAVSHSRKLQTQEKQQVFDENVHADSIGKL